MINVDGIDVNVIYKRVRKVTLKITTDAKVEVVCNKRVSREYLVSFVSKHMDWIRKNLAKKANSPLKSLSLIDGDIITILGKNYTLKIISSDKDDIVLSDDKINFYLKDKSFEKRQVVYKKWVIDTLQKIVVESIAKWHKVTGLNCSSIVFKDMKSRWGSCNVLTKKIAFSTNLISQDKDCIDYVVLHELTHTLHVNHDAKFYEQISKYLPQYKTISKKLAMPIEK